MCVFATYTMAVILLKSETGDVHYNIIIIMVYVPTTVMLPLYIRRIHTVMTYRDDILRETDTGI